MDAERWQRLSPLLDALYELTPEARTEHLGVLRLENAALADELQALLRLEDSNADFLIEPLITPPAGVAPGTMLGPYRLERMLGEGGMGQVWLAARADGLYRRRVALKLLRPGLADTNLRLRFTREQQILARLEHPHIARLLDAGIGSEGQPYLALDYVEGEPITEYCRDHQLTLDARLRLFQQVCDAVSHAHANLIVHRDLKPSNILVSAAGEVRLLDFGIAKLLDTDALQIEHTRTGVRAFTLHYAAPEQIRGDPITTMTDVYSLGVVLYELLTGCKPYLLKRNTDAEWEEAILGIDPLRPSLTVARDDRSGREPAAARRLSRALSGDLDNIALRALAKRPGQRYPSVEALELDLQRYRSGRPVLARPRSLGYRLRKYAQRHRWMLATSTLVTLVVFVALLIVAWQAKQSLREAQRAQAMQDFVVGLFENAGVAPDGAPMDARTLLEAGVQRGSRELAKQPLARAELYGVIARLRIGLGDYREALALLDRQAAILHALGTSPPSVRIGAATQRGRAQRLLGRSNDCIATMRPLEGLVEREQVQLPTQVAEYYTQYGRCRRADGDRRQARQLFERALALHRQPLDDQVGVAENLTDLAALHADAGESSAALAGFRDALAQLQRAAGERHPLAIGIDRSLGTVYRERGDVEAAASAYAAALELSDELLGPRHPTTLETRSLLAATHVDQGRFVEARDEFQAVHQQLVARLGPDHGDVGSSWNSLGIVAWELGDLDRAIRALQRAVAIWRDVGGQARLPGMLFNYGMVLHAAGRNAEARQALEESRRLRVARFGPDHALVGDTERLLGEVLVASGQVDAGRRDLVHAAALTRAGYGPGHPHALRAELSLARQQARDGEHAMAQRTFARIAALPGNDAEIRKLRWQARAYAAEARCRNPEHARARTALDVLWAQLREAQPNGGAVRREVEAIRAACR